MTEKHRAAQVIDAVVARLQDELSARVFRNRTTGVPAQELPAVIVSMGPDERIGSSMVRETWSLTVHCQILVSAQSADDVDAPALALRLAITRALRRDDLLGLPFVREVDLAEQLTPDLAEPAEGANAVMVLPFLISYEVSPADPAN